VERSRAVASLILEVETGSKDDKRLSALVFQLRGNSLSTPPFIACLTFLRKRWYLGRSKYQERGKNYVWLLKYYEPLESFWEVMLRT